MDDKYWQKAQNKLYDLWSSLSENNLKNGWNKPWPETIEEVNESVQEENMAAEITAEYQTVRASKNMTNRMLTSYLKLIAT